jgi:hypothetical protein
MGSRRTGHPREIRDADRPLKPKRFETIVEFEVAAVASNHPPAILPLESLEFHGPNDPMGQIPSSFQGLRTA